MRLRHLRFSAEQQVKVGESWISYRGNVAFGGTVRQSTLQITEGRTPVRNLPTTRVQRHLFVLPLLLQVIVIAHSQSLQGSWQGTLSGPGYNLPLIFDLTADGGGTLKSPMQNFQGTVNYSLAGDAVTIKIPSAHATYHGILNGTQLMGTWSQMLLKVPLRLDKLTVAPSAAVAAPPPQVNSKSLQPPVDSGVSGFWIGRLVGPEYDWPLHLSLNGAGSGNASSTTGGFDAVASYSVSGDQLTLSVSKIHASMQATITPGSISGTWSQNGASISINMTKQRPFCPAASFTPTTSEVDCKASVEAAKGIWYGAILQSTGVIRFKFDLHEDGSGYYTPATTNDQAKLGYYFLGPHQISIAIPSINVKIDGGISSGKFSVSDCDPGPGQEPMQCDITRGDASDADSHKMHDLENLTDAMAGKTSPSDNPTLLGAWQGMATINGTEAPIRLQLRGLGYGMGDLGPFKYTFNGNSKSCPLTLTKF
jgi:hypothetical protein